MKNVAQTAIIIFAAIASPAIAATPNNQNNYNKYIVIEKNNNTWKIAAISSNRPQREPNQEILSYPTLEPAFEYSNKYKFIGNYQNQNKTLSGKNTYECEVRLSIYSPCNTAFSSFINTDFFGLSGNNRYNLNNEEIKKAVSDISSDPLFVELDYRYLSSEENNLPLLKRWIAKYEKTFDPDNLGEHIRSRIDELSAIEDEKRQKEMRERQEQQEKRKAAMLEEQAKTRANIQQAQQAKASRQKLVKTPGQDVCKKNEGTESVYSGMVIMGKPHYVDERRTFQLTATTERSLNEKILVRISSISSITNGQKNYYQVLNGTPTFRTGDVTWDLAENWDTCSQ